MTRTNTQRGFTLVEIMVTVAIIAIIATVAVPAYQNYVKQSHISDATSALNKTTFAFEQHFQNNRSYIDVPCPKDLKNWTFVCEAADDPDEPGESLSERETYQVVATGRNLMAGFKYKINWQRTKSADTPWGSAECWVTRPSGSC